MSVSDFDLELNFNLPLPVDDILCAKCYNPLTDNIMMYITQNGVCEDNFCSSCTQDLIAREGENFLCPTCGKRVVNYCKNIAAIAIRETIYEKLQRQEEETKELQLKIEEKTKQLDNFLSEFNQQKTSLRVSLEKEQQKNSSLEKKLNQLSEKHSESEGLIELLEKKIEATQRSSFQQEQKLKKEKEKLEEMTRNSKTEDEEKIIQFQNKIKQMELSYKYSLTTKTQLERSHVKAIRTLREREKEVQKIKFEMKKQEKEKLAQSEGLLENVTKYVSIFFSSQSTDSFVREITQYILKETRGARKEGKVKKAIYQNQSGSIVALKKVEYNRSILCAPSLTSSISSYFWSQPTVDPDQIEKERCSALREAMLLHKLKNPYILHLECLVSNTYADFFYLQFPYFEYDLDFALQQSQEERQFKNRKNESAICFTKKLNMKNIQNLLYQILVAVYYLHSANVVHRHISPSTILTNDFKHFVLCGFSYSVCLDSKNTNFPQLPKHQLPFMAPELLYKPIDRISVDNWKAIDIWAIGTLFANLLRKDRLFTGGQSSEVLSSILSVSESCPQNNQTYNSHVKLRNLQSIPKKSLKSLFPLGDDGERNCKPEDVEFLSKFIKFDPAERITVEEALSDPYFRSLLAKETPTTCTVSFDLTDEEIPQFYTTQCTALF